MIVMMLPLIYAEEPTSKIWPLSIKAKMLIFSQLSA